MSTPNSQAQVPVRAIDRFLAIAALALAAASVLCFFAIIIGTALGMRHDDFAIGAWPFIAAIPLWGLPLAFGCIIALLIMSMARKAKATRAAGK